MDFQSLLKITYGQFLKGIVKLILFNLVGCLLCFTVILIPTVMAGLMRGMLRYVRDGVQPEFDELWKFDGFLPTLLLMVLGGLAVAIGLVLLIVPGVVLMVWWMYALFFIVDRKLTFIEAMGASKRLATTSGFWNHFIVLLMISVLNSLGSSIGGVGMLFTAPFGLLLLTNVYLSSHGQNVAPTSSA